MAAFRTSASFNTKPGAVAAWLRRGQVEAASIKCKEWNTARFEQALARIRVLTRKHDPNVFIPKLKQLCADAGVAVVVAPAPIGCRASGATFFVSNEKALILLSFRYLSDDHFWFTFFHEAGHLLLHEKDAIFLEGPALIAKEDEEEEANDFAANFLIPREHHADMLRIRTKMRDVIKFAHKVGISPGIVVGQMQHFGVVERSKLNYLKRRYRWTVET